MELLWGWFFEPLLGQFGGVPQDEFIGAHTLQQLHDLKARVDALPADGMLGLSADQQQRLGVPGRASLLQDVIKGRRTEAAYLNGYVVDKGLVAEVETPVNAAVADIMYRVKRMISNRIQLTSICFAQHCPTDPRAYCQ